MLHFFHLRHMISIKVVILAYKHIIYSVFYNIWLNRRHFSSKVSLIPFHYRRLLMVGIKSRNYLNLGLCRCADTRVCFLALFQALFSSDSQKKMIRNGPVYTRID